MTQITSFVLLALATASFGCAASQPPAASPGPGFQAPRLEETPVARLRAELRTAYPPLLRDARVSGEVHLRFTVREDGTVDRESIVVQRSSHSLFSEAAVPVLRRLRFEPASRAGSPVPARGTIRIQWFPETTMVSFRFSELE